MPAGINELHFSYDYTGKPDTALDILVFDSNGYGHGNDAAFRGSSGGGRTKFTITCNWATPSYRPGPIQTGNWIEYRYRTEDGAFPQAVRGVQQAGAIMSANHSFQTCKGCLWEFGYDNVDAIEVWNGPWIPDDEDALRMWDAV